MAEGEPESALEKANPRAAIAEHERAPWVTAPAEVDAFLAELQAELRDGIGSDHHRSLLGDTIRELEELKRTELLDDTPDVLRRGAVGYLIAGTAE